MESDSNFFSFKIAPTFGEFSEEVPVPKMDQKIKKNKKIISSSSYFQKKKIDLGGKMTS